MDDERVGTELRRRAAVLAGDERAWREWYDAERDALRAYVSWRCGGLRDLVDEVMQESWMTAVRRVRSFDPRLGAFGGWLRGIAANVVRNHLRTARVRRPWVTIPEGADGSVAAPTTNHAERVAHTLAALAPRHELVLRAKYLDQHSVQAIADAWGETPKAVESLLTRARQAFREAYEHAGGGHD